LIQARKQLADNVCFVVPDLREGFAPQSAQTKQLRSLVLRICLGPNQTGALKSIDGNLNVLSRNSVLVGNRWNGEFFLWIEKFQDCTICRGQFVI